MKATEIIRFLQELTNNNSREWFTENKVWYDQVRKQFEQISSDLIQRIALFDEDITVELLKNTI